MVQQKLGGEWEEKCWGKTRCTILTEHFSRHELKVEAGGYCSFHFHTSKSNQFKLLSGEVRIVWAYGWDVSSIVLTPSNPFFEMPPNLPHQFQILKSGEILEDYFSLLGELTENDITRLSVGGNVLDLDDIKDPLEIGILKSDGTKWTP